MLLYVKKNGDKINTSELERQLGVKVCEISALKNLGVMEDAIAHIEEATLHNMSEEVQRWYAIKIFERDKNVIEKLNIDPEILSHIEIDIKKAEEEADDDAESIITNERYIYISSIIRSCYIYAAKNPHACVRDVSYFLT